MHSTFWRYLVELWKYLPDIDRYLFFGTLVGYLVIWAIPYEIIVNFISNFVAPTELSEIVASFQAFYLQTRLPVLVLLLFCLLLHAGYNAWKALLPEEGVSVQCIEATFESGDWKHEGPAAPYCYRVRLILSNDESNEVKLRRIWVQQEVARGIPGRLVSIPRLERVDPTRPTTPSPIVAVGPQEILRLESRETVQVDCIIEVVLENPPDFSWFRLRHTLTETLRAGDSFCIPICYVVGQRASKPQRLLVSGTYDSFRERVIRHWRANGRENWADIVEGAT